MGHDVYYMPREQWSQVDQVFGENVNSLFDKAYKIDMYLVNVENWLGDGDFFSKFGVEIRDKTNLIVARRTFEKYIPNSIAIRPREGDLIYVPVMDKIFEISFVEEDLMFFSGGNRAPYIYELRCEAFRYANENLDTGIPEIDDIENKSTYTIEVEVDGTGNYQLGEIVYQGTDYANATMTATVSSWDPANNEVYLIDIKGAVQSGNSIIGYTSNTHNDVSAIDTMGDHVYYDLFDNKLS